MRKVIVFLLFLSFIFILNGCDGVSTLNQTSEITTIISTDDIESELDIRLKQIYELALESNSFDGTYEEWLESIQGPKGEDGKEVLFQVSEGYIQWQYKGDTEWVNLIDLTSLTGTDGIDGREVLFQVSEGYIQWQYTGDTEWINLIDLAILTGTDGVDGREVLFQVVNGYIQWQYTGDTEWVNLIEINTLTGKQGVGIKETSINASGELIIRYTDDTEVNLGIPVVLYTVLFKDGFGNVIDVQRLPFGSSATPPNAPQVDGYTFNNWNGIYENINSNVEIIAEYNKNLYTVLFNSNGGTEVDSIANIQYMDKIQLPIPEKEGYEFEGWYLDDTVNGEQFFNTTPVEGNIRLYAKWELLTYKVSYYDYNSVIVSVQDIKHGSSAIEPILEERYGYINKGWDQSNVSVKSNLDIYPIYVIDEEDMSKYIDDTNILTSIYNKLEKEFGDKITKLELLTVVNLSSNEEITSLKGLEYLLNIEVINFSNAPIIDAMALKDLSKLKMVIINQTELTNVDFLVNKPDLYFLVLDQSNINDISQLNEIYNLETLVLNDSPLEDITPLQGLNNLKTLFLNETNVSDITPLFGITSLNDLGISYSRVTDFTGISSLNHLVGLLASGIQLQSFEELSSMPQLEYLNLSNTGFSTQDIMYISELVNLDELHLGNAMIFEVGSLDQIPITTKIYLWGFDTHPLLDHRYYAFESMLNHIKLVIQESNSDIEKVLRIHDYVNKISVVDDLASVDVVELLIEGKGMCSTYTNSTTLLLAMQGIESFAIGGEGHAWNVVYLDGQCYHLDGYWNESYGYDYFMISDDTINSYRSGPMFDWMSSDSDKVKLDPCVSTLYEPLATFLNGFANTDDVYLLDTEIIYYDDINQQVKSLSYDLTIEKVIVSNVDLLLNVKGNIITYLSTTDDFVRTMNIDGTGTIVKEKLMMVKKSSLIQNAIKVSVDNPYLLTFNHNITSIDASKIYYVDQIGNIIPAEVTYNLNVLTITPSESLNSQSEYDLVLLNGAVSNATYVSTNQEIHRYFFTELVPEPYVLTVEYPTDYKLEYFQYYSHEKAEKMTIFLNADKLIKKNTASSAGIVTIKNSSGQILEDFTIYIGIYDDIKVALELYHTRDQLQIGESYTITIPANYFISRIDDLFAESDFVITVTIVDENPND